MSRDNINTDGIFCINSSYLKQNDKQKNVEAENNILFCYANNNNSDDFIHVEKEKEDELKVVTEKTDNGYIKTEYDKNGNIKRKEIIIENEKRITEFYENNKGFEETWYDENGEIFFTQILQNTKDGYISTIYDKNGEKNSEAVKKGNVITSITYDNKEIESITTTTEFENLSEEIKTDKDGNLKQKKYTYTNEDGLIIKIEDEVFTGKDSTKTTTEYSEGKKSKDIYNDRKNKLADKITKEFKEDGKTIYKQTIDKNSENSPSFLAYDEKGKQIAGKVIKNGDNGYEKNIFFSSVDKTIETIKNGDMTNTIISQNGEIIGKGIIKTNSDLSEEGTYINEKERKTIRKVSKNGEIAVKRYDEKGKEIKLADTINGEFDENTYQGGNGNCWFISGLNALNSTPKGKEIIKNAIIKNDDGSITVNFKGLGKSYTITEEEFNKYDTDFDLEDAYSNGDNDLLAFEIAYKNIVGKELFELGGQSRILIEALTGIESKTYGSYYSNCPAEKIDEALDDVLNNKNIALNFALSGLDTKHIAKRTNGETFAYMEWYSHAFAVKNVTKDTVTFINPWNSADEITMTRDEFKKLGIFQLSSCDLSSL